MPFLEAEMTFSGVKSVRARYGMPKAMSRRDYGNVGGPCTRLSEP